MAFHTDALIDIGGVALITISKEILGRKEIRSKEEQETWTFHSRNPGDRPFPGHTKKKKEKEKKRKTKKETLPACKIHGKI